MFCIYVHLALKKTKLPLQSINQSYCIAAVSCTVVEPVGRWYESYCSRRRHKHTLSYHSLNSSSEEESEGELSEDDEDDEALLKTLDRVDWKVSHTPTARNFDCLFFAFY